MKRIQALSSAILLSLVLIVVGAFTGCERQQQSDVTVIASVLPLTGPAGELGQDMRRGQELAVEYFNSRPDTRRRVQVVFEDSKSTPTEGVRAVQALLSQGQRLFIVPLSAVGMASRPVLIENKVLAFLDASHPDLTRPANPLIFHLFRCFHMKLQQLTFALSYKPAVLTITRVMLLLQLAQGGD
ncbi:MAG: ABC transporter substrate-binding protein [Acidobacteria bacterium]|nr:ABC transporter substrate-binding protein [Acidobacteriota bacterium]